MRNIKMIVTDLDRTLLRKDKTISEYTKSVLSKCHESGYLIVFATARPERATKQWQIDKSSCYVIANNGATIMHGGNIIRNIIISDDTKHGIIRRFVADKNITGICAETGDLLYSDDNNYYEWAVAYPSDIGWNPVFKDFAVPVAESICKISVECGNSELVLNILRDYPELHIFPNNGENWHQITHSSASKFSAIEYISELTGIELQDIITFGDDYNDVEMLRKCGIGVAVGNAVAEAKDAADFICETNDNDGVAKYLEKFLLAIRKAI